MMKKNKKFTRFIAFVSSLILVLCSFAYLVSASEANLTDEEKAEIQDLRDQQAALDEKIAEAEEKMAELENDIENEEAYAEQLALQLENLTDQESKYIHAAGGTAA